MGPEIEVGGKVSDFRSVSCSVLQKIQDRAVFTTEFDRMSCSISNRAISDDLD